MDDHHFIFLFVLSDLHPALGKPAFYNDVHTGDGLTDLFDLPENDGVVNGLWKLIVVLLSDSSERIKGGYFTPLPCLSGSEYVGFTGGVHYRDEILQVALSHSAPSVEEKLVWDLVMRKIQYLPVI